MLSKKVETIPGRQEDNGSLLPDHHPKCHALQPGVLLWQLQESRCRVTGQGGKDSSEDSRDRDGSTKHHLQKCCCEKAAQDPVGPCSPPGMTPPDHG